MDTMPTLQMIAPTDLVIDTNVRVDAKADKSLISSIKQHGVLQAITGQADAEGTVHVRMDQRRTLAACEAGRESVPVMVLPSRSHRRRGPPHRRTVGRERPPRRRHRLDTSALQSGGVPVVV